MVNNNFPRQYEVYLAQLDPTIGREINKTRPCLVVSPNEMNKVIDTVIIAPMTTKFHLIPSRVNTVFEDKEGWVALDQIRSIDRRRLVKYLGKIDFKYILEIKEVLREMLVD